MTAGGDRPGVVFLPGMMCDGRLFAAQIAEIEARHPVFVGDIGRHRSIDAVAQAVLDEAPFPRMAVCGLSMGGIVAMAMAALAPQRVVALALMDTNHRADAPERRPVRRRQIEAATAGRHVEIVMEEMLPGYFVDPDEEQIDLVRNMARAAGAAAFVNQSIALMERPDQRERLAAFEGPALLLYGGRDRICPPARHAEMAECARHPTCVEIPNAAHLPPIEQPAAVSAALAQWMMELERSREGR